MEHSFCFVNFYLFIFGCSRSWSRLSLLVAGGGSYPVVVLGLLTAVASLVTEHGLSSCSS